MRNGFLIGSAALVVLMLAYRRIAAAADPAPAVGAAAPEFTLKSQEGKPVSLKDFRGNWVVLYFYPKDFTRGCTIEAHNFQRDLKEYEARKAVILGVSTQSSKSHKDFCAKESLTFHLLADTDRKVSSAYGSSINLAVAKFSARHTFLIDPKGVVAARFLDVDPPKHSAQVLAALDSLTQPKDQKPR